MKAIETRYKGYRFRSRLEARWAVLFDTLKIEYLYESEGFEFENGLKYLPDFWLPKQKTWVEVKGVEPVATEIEKIDKLRQQTNNNAIIVGNIPETCFESHVFYPQFNDFGTFIKTLPGDYTNYAPKMFETSYNYIQYVCPVCKFEYVHITDIKNERSEGRSERDLTISAYCESGHYWDLCFVHHKGTTDVCVENVRKEKETTFILFLSDNKKRRANYAIESARSARFEHGENGGTNNKKY